MYDGIEIREQILKSNFLGIICTTNVLVHIVFKYSSDTFSWYYYKLFVSKFLKCSNSDKKYFRYTKGADFYNLTPCLPNILEPWAA